VFLFNERHLRTAFAQYVTYFNHWRPHRSIGHRAPYAVALGSYGGNGLLPTEYGRSPVTEERGAFVPQKP